MVVFQAQDGPVVVGHRGAPFDARENTLESFHAAAAQGATWVELDARRCVDDIVVHHDAWAEEGEAIVEATAATLRDRGILRLADILEQLPAGLGVDIELKNLPGEPDYDEEQSLSRAVARVVTGSGVPRPVVVTSFNPAACDALSGQSIPVGLLSTQWLRADAAVDLAVELGVSIVCPHVDAPGLEPPGDTAFVAHAHAAGLQVLVWTVDDPRRAAELAAAGVDAICTNVPAAIVQELRSQP